MKLHWKFQVNHFFIIKSYLDLTHKFLSINYNLPYCIENTPFISLNDYIASISFDTDELSQKFWDMAEKNNWNCLILENPENGHIHSYWKDTEHKIEKGGKDKKLAVGLIADIHSGSSYIPLRVNGVDRFPPSFEPDDIDEVPDELIPVNTRNTVILELSKR